MRTSAAIAISCRVLRNLRFSQVQRSTSHFLLYVALDREIRS